MAARGLEPPRAYAAAPCALRLIHSAYSGRVAQFSSPFCPWQRCEDPVAGGWISRAPPPV